MPIPLRIILASAGAFIVFFLGCLALGKLSMLWGEGNIPPQTIASVFLWIGLIGGLIFAIITGLAYGTSVSVQIEEQKMKAEATRKNREQEIQHTHNVRMLQNRLDDTRQLPARDREVPTSPRYNEEN